MNSNILKSFGLENTDIGLIFLIMAIIIFLLVVCCIVTLAELCKLKNRYERFCGGRSARSLEKEIGALFVENKEILEQTKKNHRDIKTINRRLEKVVQKVGLVKYDAFAQMGGKLSFSLALLDEKNNGFVLNSIHGSDGCYTYSKEIKAGTSDLQLGDEEIKAIKMAMHEE